MEFKLENKVKKYRRLLNMTARQLGGKVISEDTIYNIENGRENIGVSSMLIILSKLNDTSEKCGISLNLCLKDIFKSEEEQLEEYCRYKLNELSKNEFDENIYLELLDFVKTYNYTKVENLVKFEIGTILREIDPNKALGYLEEIYDTYDNKALVLKHMARCELRLKNYDKALILLDRAKKYCNDDELMEEIQCDIGTYLTIMKRYQEAKYIFEVFLKERIINTSLELIAKINYGVTLQMLGEYEKAIVVYEELLQIYEDKSGIYYNMSGLYKSIGDYDKSDMYLNKLIEYESNKKSKTLSNAFINLALRFKEKAMYRESIILLENSIKISKVNGQPEKSIRAYKEILIILKEINKKYKFQDYLEDILKNIGLYNKDIENKNEILLILLDFLMEDNEMVKKIIEKL